MVLLTKPGAQVFNGRDLNGAAITVDNAESATWAAEMENAADLALQTLTGTISGSIVKNSLSDLNADLAHGADTMAWVVGDSTQGNDGVYQKQGASGAGSWTRLTDLPYNVIQLNNADAGTANAIQVTTSVNVPNAAYGALLVLNITAANTGAVTLSVNSGTAKPVVTNTNAAITSGYFVAGMAVLCVDDGTSYRLMSYGDASSVQAAAEAAQLAAETAVLSAESSVGIAKTLSELKALTTSTNKYVVVDRGFGLLFYEWVSGDFSTHVATDTNEFVYVTSNSTANTSGVWRLVGDFISEGINASLFGVVDDYDTTLRTGTSCDTILNALLSISGVSKVIVPEGDYLISDMVTVPSRKQLLGISPDLTIFHVNENFEETATSVVKLQGVEPGGTLDNFYIKAYQDTTNSVRANLTQYPPLIDATDCPRHHIGHIRLSGGIVGVDATGNSGGFNWEFIEVGCFDGGVKIDGSLDFCAIGRIHSWPFDFSGTNLYNDVWSDGSTRAAEFGKIDSLSLSFLQVFRSSVHITGTDTSLEMNILDCKLDGDKSFIEVEGRRLNITNLYKTRGALPNTGPAIIMTGGKLTVSEADISENISGSGRIIDISGDAICEIRGGTLGQRTLNENGIFINSGAGEEAKLVLDNIEFDAGTGARTADLISQNGTSVLVVTNSRFSSGGTGRVLVTNADNDKNIIANNDFGDYSIASGGWSQGQYGPNRIAEFSYTPTVSFSTAGDSVITTTFSSGKWSLKQDSVQFEARVIFNTNAYTTASGFLEVSLPVAPSGLDVAPLYIGAWSHVELGAGYSQLTAFVSEAGDSIRFMKNGSSEVSSVCGISEFPASTTGFELIISGTIRTV